MMRAYGRELLKSFRRWEDPGDALARVRDEARARIAVAKRNYRSRAAGVRRNENAFLGAFDRRALLRGGLGAAIIAGLPLSQIKTAEAANNPNFLTPEMYGAKGNGSDDTTALGNFFTALQTSGMEGRLGARTYVVSSNISITSPIKLSGVGHQLSTIHNSNGSQTISVLGFSSAAATGTTLRDFGITAASGFSGQGIYFGTAGTPLGLFVIDSIYIQGTAVGLQIAAQTNGGLVNNVQVNSTTSHGIWIDGANLSVTNCTTANCGGSGLYFTAANGGGAGLILKGCTAYLSTGGPGFYFLGNTTHNLGAMVISDCVASETAGGEGFKFDTHGGGIAVSNCYCELAGLNASSAIITANAASYLFTNNNYALTLSNLVATFGSGCGIEIGCYQWSLTGANINQVNLSNNDSGAGVLIAYLGSGIAQFTMTGVNTAFVSGGQNNQAYGLNIYAACSNGVISGNVFQGNTAGIFRASGDQTTLANNVTLT